jgi:hypothetical protein
MIPYPEILTMYRAVIMGAPFSSTGLPDTPEYRRQWARLAAQVAEIVAAGGIPDIPFE